MAIVIPVQLALSYRCPNVHVSDGTALTGQARHRYLSTYIDKLIGANSSIDEPCLSNDDTIYRYKIQLQEQVPRRCFRFPVPRNKYSIRALDGTHCQFGSLSNNIYLAGIDFVGMILVSRVVASIFPLAVSLPRHPTPFTVDRELNLRPARFRTVSIAIPCKPH